MVEEQNKEVQKTQENKTFKNNNGFKQYKPEIVSKNKMLEAGVYFGQRTSQWNPKMRPYILMSKRRIHIIDIQKTKKSLEFAFQIINKMAQKGASFIFVGTKKQAKQTIKENALRTNSSYVSERWLGGMLTNNRTIFQRVRRMHQLEKLQENNFEGYTKKEGILFSKEFIKLQKNLSGIKNMRSRPNVMIVADPKTDEIAIKEAKKLGIKVIGIADTNVDPTTIDVVIPGNDDSVKSLTLIITILADAIAKAKGGVVKFAYKKDSEIILPEEIRPERKKWNNRFNNRGFDRDRRDNNLKLRQSSENSNKNIKQENKTNVFEKTVQPNIKNEKLEKPLVKKEKVVNKEGDK